MTVHDYFAVVILIQLTLFALAFFQLKVNHPSQYRELGGDKAWLGFLSTMQFIAFFMVFGFLKFPEKPTLTKKELTIYFGFSISSWGMILGVIYLLINL